MMKEFSFSWNGRKWNGYFNAIAHETVIAHFEDDVIREAVGQSVSYFKTETGAINYPAHTQALPLQQDIYTAILKGVENRLGKPLHVYLN